MAEEPQQLKQDIEGTRSQLSNDLDALTDRLNPSNVAQRQVDKAKANVATGIAGVKDRVMGSAHDVADTARNAADSGRGGASDGKAAVKQRTRGNPMAAGLIAFGAGWLLSSLIPTASAEKDLASAAKDKDAPLVDAAAPQGVCVVARNRARSMR